MANIVTYPVGLIDTRLSDVVSAVDSGPSNGFMRLLDSGGNVLSSIQLAKPSGVAAGGVLTFSGLSLVDPSAAASGTAVAARVDDSLGNTWISGITVGTAVGASFGIVLSPTNVIVAGQTIAITNAAITGH